MQIRQLILRGFMRHRDLTVNLPQAGVMLITGKNGVGKSSLVEAISYGLWGRTLRGTDPWPEGGGELTVVTDKLTIVRQCTKGGKKSLSWGVTHEEPHEYSTPTKAQEALDHVVGPWEVWRRTSVFSSQDAAHFTMATDGERKRLLESLLGLERFDRALELCRADRAAVERAEDEGRHELDMFRARIGGEEMRYADAKALIEEYEQTSPKAIDADFEKIAGMSNSAKFEWEEALTEYRALDVAGAEQHADAREVSARIARLSSKRCPTCGQDIPQALVEGLRKQMQALEEDSVRRSKEAEDGKRELGGRIKDLEEEWRALFKRASEVESTAKANKQLGAAKAKAADMCLSAHKAVLDLKARLGEAEERARIRAAELGVLRAVEFVLGLRGARAQVLGRALSGVEAAANMWLARIVGDGLRLSLSPCQEKKTGGTIDAIALAVEGAGGGQGYKGASGGERRRIDVAILMALAEVAGAGKARGLVAFDEVFDALDLAGVESVSGVLADLAGARPVMLITHSEALIGAVQAAQTLRM